MSLLGQNKGYNMIHQGPTYYMPGTVVSVKLAFKEEDQINSLE